MRRQIASPLDLRGYGIRSSAVFRFKYPVYDDNSRDGSMRVAQRGAKNMGSASGR